MALTLHVISYKNLSPTTELSVTVNETDCTIGRASSNDFVLPDVERIISHRHASIQFEDGSYYITDNSTNGTFINHAPAPVGQGNKILLHDGDILTIGKFDCVISIAEQQKPAENSLLDKSMWQPPLHSAAEEKKPNLVHSPFPKSVEQEYFRPPEAIREDWDELTGLMRKVKIEPADFISESAIPQAIPEPVIEQQTPAPHVLPSTNEKQAVKPVLKQHGNTQETAVLHQQMVDAFLTGTGLNEVNLEPEEMINFMHTAGQSLRELTQGYKQVLSTRTSLKNEFRLGMTTMQPTENNPLKISVDVEDALIKLLLPSMRGYLPAIEAIQEATDDLQAHQMALLAGLRAALSSLVALFDPEALEKDLQKASTVDNLLPSVRKAKYWELFKKNYRTAAADAENDFLHFLGDEFNTAYEQQIQRLKSIRYKNKQ
jgi:type VI secretion system FHA domain protein